MKEEEINIAIAEACGWQRVKGEECFFDNGSEQIYIENIPNYCNDLDAMHEAEKFLTIDQEYDYGCELASIVRKQENNISEVNEDYEFPLNGWGFYAFAQLSARQRAGAFLKTIKKIGRCKMNAENQSNEAVEGLLKKEETITMKLSDYDCIISKLDNARKEADFYKAKYEALLEETQNER